MDYSGDYNCIMDYCWYFYLFCLQLCTTKFGGLASQAFDASKCTCKLDYSSGTIFQAFTYSVYLFIFWVFLCFFLCVCVCVCLWERLYTVQRSSNWLCVTLKQLLYETCLCVWLLSYYEPAIEYLATSRTLPRLIEVVKSSTKEKVRILSFGMFSLFSCQLFP